MLLNTKSISVSIAVLSFFGIAVVGWFTGLSQLTCCKRALAAAVIAYIGTSIALKVVNAILINVMVDSQINQPKDAANDSGN